MSLLISSNKLQSNFVNCLCYPSFEFRVMTLAVDLIDCTTLYSDVYDLVVGLRGTYFIASPCIFDEFA